MVLCIVENGIAREAITTCLAQHGHAFAVASPSHEDLFSVALHRKAIVYVASPRLLDGWMHPAPSIDRIRSVLGAAQAPGVELVVAVFPGSDGYEAEEAALRTEGKPYIVLRAPPLAEELAEDVLQDDERSLWVPEGAVVRACEAGALATAVLSALSDERQGRAHDVPSEAIDLPKLFRRVAQRSPRPLRVHLVPRTIFRMARPVARWMRGKEPVALTLYDRLATSSA